MSDFRESFYKQLPVSQRTKVNYRIALNSSFVRMVLQDKCGTEDIFSLTDLPKLWEVYSYINLHDSNIKNHRIYSAAIMRYIRFLNNGEKYGKRVNALKPKKRLKNNK